MISLLLFGGIGIICLLYYIVLVSYAGIGASFANVWLLIAVLSFLLVFGILYLHKKDISISPVFKLVVIGVVGTGLISLLVIQGIIVSAMFSKPQKDLDYIIILGAQVRGTEITSPLQYRLDEACTYLNENSDTVVIVSGGQGDGEAITEAQAMYEYLVKQGIENDRIILENEATNTEENIHNSMEIISQIWKQESSPTYGVVTNNFHTYRAVAICEKMGYQVDGISAKTNWRAFPNYMLREYFAIVKYKLVGAI